MQKERYRIAATVYAVIIEDGRLLLSLRHNDTGSMDGKYSLVGGPVEASETLAEAMIREAKEKAGIVIEKMHLGTTLFRFGMEPDFFNDCINFFFVLDKFSGSISNNEPDKCKELEFLPIYSLPRNVVDYIKYSLKNVLTGVAYCEWFPAPGTKISWD
ncbi:MAG: NUDIX domain-containing protein [Rickettsiales bacterium]|jgi:8-oxo-dGTP pyrophosphatase MutT (NUDIX family)|nr:NUDIX domain-containing protein [Rickettsiales bacterium]